MAISFWLLLIIIMRPYLRKLYIISYTKNSKSVWYGPKVHSSLILWDDSKTVFVKYWTNKITYLIGINGMKKLRPYNIFNYIK